MNDNLRNIDMYILKVSRFLLFIHIKNPSELYNNLSGEAKTMLAKFISKFFITNNCIHILRQLNMFNRNKDCIAKYSFVLLLTNQKV